MTSKNYGSMFLKCLAPMDSTDSIRYVKQFLTSREAQTAKRASNGSAE